MSMGYGAIAKLVASDEKVVLYEYSGFNWNIEGFEELNFDGLITIERSCFVNAEQTIKITKTSSGKKQCIKKVLVPVSADDLVEHGKIDVENCSNCWATRGILSVDIMALSLINICLEEYQLNEELSNSVGIQC